MPLIASKSQKTLLAGTEDVPLNDVTTDYRATTRQIAAHHFPKFASGLIVYPIMHIMAAATQAIVAGSYYGNIFRARPGDQFDRVLIEVTTDQTVDGNMRFGMYAHDEATRKPNGAPLADSGSIAFTAASMNVNSGIPKSIVLPSAFTVPDAGVFWIVMQVDVAMNALRRGAPNNNDRNYLPGVVAANALNSAILNAGLAGTGTYGSMPTAPISGFNLSVNLPYFALMKA